MSALSKRQICNGVSDTKNIFVHRILKASGGSSGFTLTLQPEISQN